MTNLIVFTCVLVSIATSVAAQEIHVPTPSTWTLNPAKSDNGDVPQVRSETVTFLRDTAQMLSFREVWIDVKGKKGSASFNGPEDGAAHFFVNSKMRGSFTPTGNGRFTDEDGSVSDVQLGISQDARTLTMTSVYKARDGSQHRSKDVFDRVISRKPAR